MLTVEDLLNGLPPELTLRFFATFARMEFPLKQCSLLRIAADGEVAQIGQPGLVYGSEPVSSLQWRRRRLQTP
jgi:hypothetical protein